MCVDVSLREGGVCVVWRAERGDALTIGVVEGYAGVLCSPC